MSYQETHRSPAQRDHWQDWTNLVLAVWLFVSPWILKFAVVTTIGPAMYASWNAWSIGVIVFVISLSGLYREEPWPEWINFVLGAWLFIAPWFIGFAAGFPMAAWDHWIVGAAIGLLALWGAGSSRITGPRVHA